MQSLIFSPQDRTSNNHFLKNLDRIAIIREIITMVVIGIYIFKLGLSIIISPGSRPTGNFPSHGQRSPTDRNITPMPINTFCMTTNSLFQTICALPLGQFLQQRFHHIAVSQFSKMLHNDTHGLHGTFVFCNINVFINPGHDLLAAGHLREV